MGYVADVEARAAIRIGSQTKDANIVKHAPGDYELLVRETPDGALVDVTDFEDQLPDVKEPDGEPEGGRGLFLLSCLTDELQTQPLLRKTGLVPGQLFRWRGGRTMMITGTREAIRP